LDLHERMLISVGRPEPKCAFTGNGRQIEKSGGGVRLTRKGDLRS
jgi:hypothetical protein